MEGGRLSHRFACVWCANRWPPRNMSSACRELLSGRHTFAVREAESVVGGGEHRVLLPSLTAVARKGPRGS